MTNCFRLGAHSELNSFVQHCNPRYSFAHTPRSQPPTAIGYRLNVSTENVPFIIFRVNSLQSLLAAALLDMAGLVAGLLTTREENITNEAGRWLDCSKWPDLMLAGRDGAPVDCHRAVLLPLSRVLQEIFASSPDVFSQEITTVFLPVPGVELANLVELLYKGSVVTSQLRETQTALTLLGIEYDCPILAANG